MQRGATADERRDRRARDVVATEQIDGVPGELERELAGERARDPRGIAGPQVGDRTDHGIGRRIDHGIHAIGGAIARAHRGCRSTRRRRRPGRSAAAEPERQRRDLGGLAERRHAVERDPRRALVGRGRRRRRLGRARQQALLQRHRVAARQPRRERHRERADADRRDQEAGPGVRHDVDQEPDQLRAEHVADPVGADVEHDLGGPLVVLDQRRIDQLVAGAVHRVAGHRLGAAGDRRHQRGRHGEREDPEHGDRGGQRGHAARDAEPRDQRAAHRDLDDRGDHAGHGVEDRQRSQEAVVRRPAHDVGLEGVVHDRGGDRAEDDQPAEDAQQRRPGRGAQRHPGVAGRDAARRAALDPAGQPERHRAGELQPGEHQQDRVGRQVHRGALRDHAAEDAAQRRADADPRDVALGALDVEPLVDDRPEPRDQHRARGREVEEHDHRDHARGAPDQQPLADRERRADHVEHRDQPQRPPAHHQPAGEQDDRQRAHRRDRDEDRQRRDVEPGEQDRVARRLAGDERRDHDHRADRGDPRRATLVIA